MKRGLDSRTVTISVRWEIIKMPSQQKDEREQCYIYRN